MNERKRWTLEWGLDQHLAKAMNTADELGLSEADWVRFCKSAWDDYCKKHAVSGAEPAYCAYQDQEVNDGKKIRRTEGQEGRTDPDDQRAGGGVLPAGRRPDGEEI